jgi:hypothetical protein
MVSHEFSLMADVPSSHLGGFKPDERLYAQQRSPNDNRDTSDTDTY